MLLVQFVAERGGKLGVILVAVVSNIESSWGSEVPELILRVSAV